MQDTIVLVFGHKRPRALSYVLEGLKRQDALSNTQVWLDGHQHFSELIPKVRACRNLKEMYPASLWMEYGSRSGLTKIFINAMHKVVGKYGNIVIIEDDCFPAPNAIASFESSLDVIRDDPRYFSVYGHHFGTDDEGAETTAFQCWGWATTSEKMQPVLEEFERLWMMPEPECVEYVVSCMTPEIRAAMDVFGARAELRLLDERFCYDAMLAFLAAQKGMKHRKTPQQVVFNFGFGPDSGHFIKGAESHFAPPYNMITEEDLVHRFNLHHLYEMAHTTAAKP